MRRLIPAALAAVVAAAMAGCAVGTGGGDGIRVVTEDRNGDGRPDRWLHCRGRDVVRKLSDLNYDGRPDVTTDFDVVEQRGRACRRVREERDSDFDGRADRWQVFLDGARVALSEDRDGDGRPDFEQRFTTGGRLTGVSTDRDGDGKVDMARHLDGRGGTSSIGYDEDGDGRFETHVVFEEGRPVEIRSGGETSSPGHFFHTRGLDSVLLGFARDAGGEIHVRVRLINSSGSPLSVPGRPARVEFHMRDADADDRSLKISADVPRRSSGRVELGRGESRTLAFPVDFRVPQGAYHMRATLHFDFDENAPTGWTGRTTTGEIAFDGRVGKMDAP
jgi:hypothetical protein